MHLLESSRHVNSSHCLPQLWKSVWYWILIWAFLLIDSSRYSGEISKGVISCRDLCDLHGRTHQRIKERVDGTHVAIGRVGRMICSWSETKVLRMTFIPIIWKVEYDRPWQCSESMRLAAVFGKPREKWGRMISARID